MKFTYALLLTTLICFTAPTFTANAQSEESSDSEKKPTKKAKKSQRDSSKKKKKNQESTNSNEPSSAARATNMGHAALRTGYLMGMGGSTGLEGMYYQDKSTHYGLVMASKSVDLTSAVASEETDSVQVDKATASATLVLSQMRYFFGNSFYMTGGFGLRTIKTGIEISDRDTRSTLKMDITSDAWVAEVAIGNLWSFDSGFILGADWIGYIAPLTASSKSTSETTGPISIANEEFTKTGLDMGKKLGEIGTTMLLVLNIGFAF